MRHPITRAKEAFIIGVIGTLAQGAECPPNSNCFVAGSSCPGSGVTVCLANATGTVIFQGSDITISLTGGGNISVHGNFGSIGTLTVNGNGSVEATIDFTDDVIDVGAIVRGSGMECLELLGVILGDLGSISASKLGLGTEHFVVVGDVNGDIELDSADEWALGGLVVFGNLFGDINVEESGIFALEVRGRIGNSAEDRSTIDTADDINIITAGEMNVGITAGVEEPANVYRLRVDDDDELFTGNGSFTGFLSAASIALPLRGELEDPPSDLPQVVIDGDLGGAVGSISLSGDLLANSDGTPKIVVGADFLDGASIEVDGELSAQFVLNQMDGGGQWEVGAQVLLDDNNIVLTGPSYAATADSLGGGSIGHASYRLHKSSCDPPLEQIGPTTFFIPGELVVGGPGLECVHEDIPSIELEFYGPIGVDSSSGAAVKVEVRDGGSFVDVSSGFTTSAGANDRRVRITPTSQWLERTYRFSRQGSRVTCTFVEGPPAVASFTAYIDVVYEDCGAGLLGGFDLNSDSAVTAPGDVPVQAASPSDLNGDNIVNASDVGILLDAIDLAASEPEEGEYYEGPWEDVE